jgi:hypothetical protein
MNDPQSTLNLRLTPTVAYALVRVGERERDERVRSMESDVEVVVRCSTVISFRVLGRLLAGSTIRNPIE